MLEEVPGFIRGMVISNIKKDVPENRREYFIPVLRGESDLKKTGRLQGARRRLFDFAQPQRQDRLSDTRHAKRTGLC